jgi:hypothetical protein
MGKHRMAWYSRGIRQRVYKKAVEQDWKKKHSIWIGDGEDIPGPYSELLGRSIFCLVMPGELSSCMSDVMALFLDALCLKAGQHV